MTTTGFGAALGAALLATVTASGLLAQQAPATQGPVPAEHVALIARYADALLAANNGTGGQRTVFAQALMDGVNDAARADELADYYVLDIRSAADYAAGHVPGAVHVPFADVAKPATLAALPTDRPILVVCYSGHTASIATAFLALLGYDAWTLRFGMLSWKASSTVTVWSSAVRQEIAGGGYPLVTGPTP